MVIHNMRAAQPAYNLISNNCQNFAAQLLDAIQVGAHREFATVFAVYKRATGKGEIKDLFEPEAKNGGEGGNGKQSEEDVKAHEAQKADGESAGQVGRKVMQEKTKRLEFHPEALGRMFGLHGKKAEGEGSGEK